MRGIYIVTFILLLSSASIACEKITIEIDDDNINQGENGNGGDITTPANNHFQMERFGIFEAWEQRQGGAVYGDYLITLNATDRETNPNGFIYDIQSGRKICDMYFPNTLDGKSYYKPHANQVSFGEAFYDAESSFPLLYVSQVNGGSGYNDIRGERGVLVYNLKQTSNNTYEPELVQAVIPDLNDSSLMKKIGNYTPNYIVDPEHNQFVIIGYPNNSWYDLSGEQPVVLIEIPQLSDGSEVVFTKDAVIDSYTLDMAIGPQQSFYYGGKIFSSGGDRGQASLRVIDLASKSVEYYKDMSVITNGEPQFLGLWGSKVLYYEYDTSGQIYELKIPGYSFDN